MLNPHLVPRIRDESSTDPAVILNNQRIKELANNGENCASGLRGCRSRKPVVNFV